MYYIPRVGAIGRNKIKKGCSQTHGDAVEEAFSVQFVEVVIGELEDFLKKNQGSNPVPTRAF